jgi:two-component system chemotaxis response regulator CheB
MKDCKVVVIGASAGGVRALQEFFHSLPPEPLGIAFTVVIHIGKSTSVDYNLIYGRNFKGKIVDIVDKTKIEAGNAYFAPAGYHVLIEKDGTFSLTQDEVVNFARPSIDVTFSSFAETYGSMACGVLLTGSNEDGASGLKDLFEVNSLTLVQDPATCEYSAMPEAALQLFKPSAVLSVPRIAARISSWAKEA